MKLKVFLKLPLFTLLFLGTLHMLFNALPYYWGNDHISKKYAYINAFDLKPNTYFLGSSSIQRGVIPNVFDSIVGNNTFSYNIASDGTLSDQLFYLLDHALDDPEVHTVFFELNDFENMHKNRYLTTKTKYYSGPRMLLSQIKYMDQTTTFEDSLKTDIKKKFVFSFFENLFKVGYRKDIIENLFNPKAVNAFGSRQGFVKTNAMHMPESQHKRIKATLNIIKNSISHAQRKKSNQTNEAVLNLIYKYLNKSIRKNKKLIFIFSPKFTHGMTPSEIYALYLAIPEEYKINMADPNKYPEFYEFENRYDQMHFNENGAKLFTKELATAFQNLNDN